MLNVQVYRNHRSVILDTASLRNPYIPKQERLSYLTTSCIITFVQSFRRVAGRFNFV